MARRERRVGVIRCASDVATLDTIASSGGLSVKPANAPGEFYVINSGRNLASELEEALLTAVACHLDNAVEKGIIPRWSLIAPRNNGAMPQFMGITHLLAF